MIKEYYNIFYESLLIALKSLKEYKSNLIASFIHHLFFLINFPFAYVFFEQFGSIIGWTFEHFVVFSFFSAFPVVIIGTFCWGKKLKDLIPKGDLNLHILRPKSIFFRYYFTNINYIMPVFIVYSFISSTFLFYLFVDTYYFVNILICFIVVILLGVLSMTFTMFYDSFNFYFLNISESLDDLTYELREMLEVFPGSFFMQSKLKHVLYLSPVFFVATLIVPIYFNNLSNDLLNQFYIIIILIIFFGLGTLINWHYGLKKYEAFG